VEITIATADESPADTTTDAKSTHDSLNAVAPGAEGTDTECGWLICPRSLDRLSAEYPVITHSVSPNTFPVTHKPLPAAPRVTKVGNLIFQIIKNDPLPLPVQLL
jgi:hypothetical protein